MHKSAYFSWETASKIECALELKARAHDGRGVIRNLRVDSVAICIGCGRKPKVKERCYVPSKTLSNNNKVIGHADCVDRLAAQYVAKSAAEERAIKTRDLLVNVPKLNGDGITPAREHMPVNVRELLYNVKQVAKTQAETEAYWRGYTDALVEVQKSLQS